MKNYRVLAGIVISASLFCYGMWLIGRGERTIINREWKDFEDISMVKTGMPFNAKVLRKASGYTGAVEYSNRSQFVYVVVEKTNGEELGIIIRNPAAKDLTNINSLVLEMDYRFPDVLE